MTTRASAFALSLLAVTSLACGGPRRYLHPALDAGSLRRVAVLPLDNLSPDRVVAAKAQRLLVLELLASGAFEVAESSYVQRLLAERKIDESGKLTPEDLKALGGILKVDGLFLGTVLDFSEGRGSSSTNASLELRLVETGTGKTVWTTKVSRSGSSLAKRLFGVGDASATDVLDDLVREALGTLLR